MKLTWIAFAALLLQNALRQYRRVHTSKTCFPEKETDFLVYSLQELYLLPHVTKLNVG